VLDTILFGLKILLLILLYLFIWWVARAVGRDLSETADSASSRPRVVPELPPRRVARTPMAAVPGPIAGTTLDGPAFGGEARDLRRAERESERSGAGLDMMVRVRPRLIVEHSPVLEQGTEVELHGWVTFGRSPGSDVPLDDGFVSSTHARILPRGQYFFIEDLGSTNGTFVNEKRVREAQLRPDARVRIGETAFRYEE
jgi:pSer/pThr/pTyr-binding forkhead associated (FHA) protein